MKRQTAVMLAVALFVGLGILVYELSWYASDTVVRALLAMAIPACAVSLMASVFYAPKPPTVEYFDPYPEQHKKEEEQEERDRETPQIEMDSPADKLNWKQNSDRTITL